MSSSFTLLYEDFEEFNLIFKENPERKDFNEIKDKISNRINSMTQIIEGYDVFPHEYLNGLYDLSDFISNYDEERDRGKLENIQEVFKVNSMIRVPQYHHMGGINKEENDSNEVINFFEGLIKVLK